jgi:prepilin-type N-terminal cleavage/methylation domain-containing protein
MKKIKLQSAFTLAEVLITLAIIGIVAALTIPNLLTEYKARQLHSQFIKSYSTLQQAAFTIKSDEVSLDPNSYQAETFYLTFLKYVKIIVNCGCDYKARSKITACYSSDKTTKIYKTLNKKSADVNMLDDGQLVLLDGTNLLFDNPSGPAAPRVFISVDLNGFLTPPNLWGYDLFTFQLVDENFLPMGNVSTLYSDTDTMQYCSLTSTDNLNGITCAERAKNEGLDYFKWVVKNVK